MGEEKRRKRNKRQTSKLTNTYTNKVDKKASTPYLLKEEEKLEGGGHQGEQASKQWGQTFLGAKGNHFNMKNTKKVWILKGK